MSQSVKHPRKTTMYDHIRELQKRFAVSAIALTIAGFVVYLFYKPILAFLSSPLNAPLYYNSPAGGFSFVMKICFTGGLIVTVPIIIYNLIMFVRPAFNSVLTMKRVLITTISSTVLSFAGAAFAFFVILPGCLLFFKGYQVTGLSALISADSYLNFVTNIIITFVIMFQIPLVMTFIDMVKPLSPRKLMKWNKWVIVGSLVVALLAPFTYDFVTSILIAVPIIALYNLSIVIVLYRHAGLKRKKHSVNKKPNHIQPDTEVDTELLMLIKKFTSENNEKAHTSNPQMTTAKTESSFDFKSNNSLQPLAPSKSVSNIPKERIAKRAEPGKKVRLISDFR